MCHYLSSDVILARLLSRTVTPISVNQLRELRKKLEKHIPSLYVDVTFSSLCAAVEGYSEMFAWDGNSIKRASKAETFYEDDYLNQVFYSSVPSELWKKLDEAIDSEKVAVA